MMSLAPWLIPMLIVAVVVAVGASVQGRTPPPARKLLWGGVGLLVLAQVWGVVNGIVFVQLRMPIWAYSALSVANSLLHLIGIVLLLLAIGRAAGGGNSGYPGSSYPGQYPSQQGQFPTQQCQPYGQPGTGGSPGPQQ